MPRIVSPTILTCLLWAVLFLPLWGTSQVDSAGREEPVFTMVDEMPSFPGGEKKMHQYIRKNLDLPEEVKKGDLSGKTYVSFVVDKNGAIHDIRSINSLCDRCAQEAERLVREMPKWKPGRLKGEAVQVRVVLPVRFHKTDQ